MERGKKKEKGLKCGCFSKAKVSRFCFRNCTLLVGDGIWFWLFLHSFLEIYRLQKGGENIKIYHECVCWGGETDNKIDPPLNAHSSIYVFDNETEMLLVLRKQQLHNQEGRAE